MKLPDCIFCNIDNENFLLKNENAFVINDKFPQSKGHLLVIPFDHHENYFDVPKDVRKSMWDLIDSAKKLSDENHSPSAYNLNVNAGRDAGQIVMHAHIHLIPRYSKK